MEPAENAAAPAAPRDGRGRWAPGQSGNLAGKPPGTKNRATLLREWLQDGEEGQAVRALIDKAVEGNGAAARWLIDGLAPKPRGRTISLDLPPDASVPHRIQRAVDLMCAGEISPDEARQILGILYERPSLERAQVAEPASEPVPAPTVAPAPRPVAAAPDDGPDSGLSPEFHLNLQARRAAQAERAATRGALLSSTTLARPPTAPPRAGAAR